MSERTVLCGSNSYTEKYYFNPDFSLLPKSVQQELQILCVSFTEEAGGTLLLSFDGEGTLTLEVGRDEKDFLYDEIEAELSVRRLQKEKCELFRQLEQFYGLVFLRLGREGLAAVLEKIRDNQAAPAGESEEQKAARELTLEDYIAELLEEA